MRRSQPTTKLDVFGPLGLLPEVAACKTIDSKRNDDLYKEKPCDLNSKLNDSIEVLAFQNNEEHREMLILQKQMLENARRQSIIDTNRVEQVKETLHDLRHRFIETNTFLQECGDKKVLAEKLIAEEKLTSQKLKKENAKLLEDIEKLQCFRSILSKTVKVLEPYEQVLEEAATIDPVWTSSKDVMNRCDAMMLTQDEVFKMECEKVLEMEQLRQKMVKMTTDATIAILGLNTTLHELERELSKAEDNCFHWEKLLFNIRDSIIKKRDEKARVSWEVDRMYRMLCKYNRVRIAFPEYEIEKRWDYIRSEIHILRDVLKEWHDGPKEQSEDKTKMSNSQYAKKPSEY